jgi:hypothetical protein
MTAETPTSAQQSAIGIISAMPAVSGATVTGVTDGVAAAGMSINGCVFFICTGLDAGAGTAVIRAVSFFGLTGGGLTGSGGGTAFETGALDFPADGGGGGTNRGAWTGLLGAGGIDGLATGGGDVFGGGGG